MFKLKKEIDSCLPVVNLIISHSLSSENQMNQTNPDVREAERTWPLDVGVLYAQIQGL